MKKNTSKKNKQLCHGCNDCCHYVATEIDRPTTKKECQNIIWFLLHKNVRVYVDFSNDWFLEFITPCEALDKNNLCSQYKQRPQMCRDYNQEDCTRYNSSSAEKIFFNSAADFKKYLSRKKIDWQYKKIRQKNH